MIRNAVSTSQQESDLKMPLALFLAALTVGCATTDPADAQVAQESCITREPVTGSNIPARVTCPAANAAAREEQTRRAEALREDYRRRNEIRRPDPTAAP